MSRRTLAATATGKRNEAMSPKPHVMTLLTALVFLASLAVVCLPATAAVTWDGSTNMNWTQPDATSWSGGTYASGDDASFLGAGAGAVMDEPTGKTTNRHSKPRVGGGCGDRYGSPDPLAARWSAA